MKNDLDEKYFDPDAPFGVPVRYLHDGCSDGKDPCLIVTRTKSGWQYYCHRCGVHGHRGLVGLPVDTVRKFVLAGNSVPPPVQRRVRLPEDYTPGLDRCPEGYSWLLSLGITDEQIKRYRIGYSPGLKRVIFPIYRRGRLVFWQGRALDPGPDRPKWVSVRSSRDASVWFYARGPDGRRAVALVEDMVSAIKVSGVTHAIALLGVYIPDSLALMIKKLGLHCVVWLDRDKAERSLYYAHRLRHMGVSASILVTPKDPKHYTTDYLRRFLHHDKLGEESDQPLPQ